MREQIYSSLINDVKNKPRHVGKTIFRASSLSFCERRIMYGVLSEAHDYDIDPRGTLTLAIGTQVHEIIQDTLINNDWITNCEDEVEWKEYNLNGHRDGDCYISSNNKIMQLGDREPNAIFELKTTNAQGFMRMHWNKAPKKDHIQQVNTYMGLTGYKKAVIVYVNKNGLTAYTDKDAAKWPKTADSYIQEFIVDFSQELFDQTEAKLKRLNDYYETKELPGKLPSGSYECNYCNYKNICKPPRKKKAKEIEDNLEFERL